MFLLRQVVPDVQDSLLELCVGALGIAVGQLLPLVGNLAQEAVQLANNMSHIGTFLYST